MFEIRLETRQRTERDTVVAFPVSVVCFEGVPLAIASGGDHEHAATEYIKTHGYLARWSKQWLQGNQINWSDDLYVEVPDEHRSRRVGQSVQD